MKTEVYSWRVSAELKAVLEREAHRRKQSLSAVLNLATREWLNKIASDVADEEEQRQLQDAGARSFGTISGGAVNRSETVRDLVRQRLRRKRAR